MNCEDSKYEPAIEQRYWRWATYEETFIARKP